MGKKLPVGPISISRITNLSNILHQSIILGDIHTE